MTNNNENNTDQQNNNTSNFDDFYLIPNLQYLNQNENRGMR